MQIKHVNIVKNKKKNVVLILKLVILNAKYALLIMFSIVLIKHANIVEKVVENVVLILKLVNLSVKHALLIML